MELAHEISNSRSRIEQCKPHVIPYQNDLPPSGNAHAAEFPVPHLLRSNFPPFEEEMPLILEFIQRAQREEERLRTHGESLGWQIAFDRLQGQKSVLSTIRRVPLELWQNIFMHTATYIPNQPNQGYHEIYSGYDTIWPSRSLARVSRSWRTAALLCPSIWRRLPSIDLDKMYTHKSDYINILKSVMERTGDGPIYVHFHAVNWGGSVNHPALDLLLAHSSRWRGARISLTSPLLKVLHSVENRLALLEDLIIRVLPTSYSIPGASPNHTTIPFFRHAPKLRRALIRGAHGICFSLPQSGLVEYQQESCDILQTYITLRVKFFDSLTRLSIRSFYTDANHHWSNITLVNLIYLRVQFLTASRYDMFLSALTLPCIEEMEISAVDSFLASSVSSILLRSFVPSPLKRLYLRSDGYGGNLQLVSLLRLAPFLTHINVTIPPIDDWRLLSGDGSLVPHLQVCEFDASSQLLPPDDTIRYLSRFAKLRCEPRQTILPEEHNDIEHRILIIYVHFEDYIARDYVKPFHDWSAYSENLSELIELERQLLKYTWTTRPPMRANNWLNRRKLVSILNKAEAYKVGSSGEIIISGIYNAVFHFSYYPNKQVSLQAQRILKGWDPLLKLSSTMERLHWVLYNMKSLAYISQSNPTRLHHISPSKLITGIQLLDCDPNYYSWPVEFI